MTGVAAVLAEELRTWLGQWVADDTPLKRVLTAQRWVVRAYFEARYLVPDPWRLRTSPYELQRAADTLAFLEGRRYRRALEVGCGEGTFTVQLLGLCDRVVAVDFSRGALRRARHRLAGEPRVELRVLDVVCEDPGGGFDLVVCAELFYYMSRAQLEAVARRVVRWLSLGGDLCLVHGTSPHDAVPEFSPEGRGREMGARQIHGLFCRMAELTVVRDRLLPRYRLTLLRRRGDPNG